MQDQFQNQQSGTLNDTKYQNLRQMLPNQGLSGLHIKLKLKNQVKRIIVPNQPTYDELCFLIQRHLKDSLSNNVNNLKLFYIDDDQDLVNLNDDNDLSIALSLGSTLKIHVFDSQTAPFPDKAFSPNSPFNLSGLQALEIKQILLDLDNKLNSLIKKDPSLTTEFNQMNISSKQNNNSDSTKQFDPLNQVKTEPAVVPSAPTASEINPNPPQPAQAPAQPQYSHTNSQTPSAPSQPVSQFPPNNVQPPSHYPPTSTSQSYNPSSFYPPNSSAQSPYYPPPPPTNSSFYPPPNYPITRPGAYPPPGNPPPPPPHDPSNYQR